MKTVLLTGATGFLGSYLLEALLKAQYQVVILKRSKSDTWRIKHLVPQVKSYDVDIQNLEIAFSEQKIDIVIHTACSYGRKGESISDIVNTNLMYSLRILDACITYNTSVFINTDTFFNTGALIQSNLNTYTLSKKQFVEWLQQESEKIKVVNLKLEHIYGPKDTHTKFITWILMQLKEVAIEIKLTSGEQERDFIYISDVVAAYLIILKQYENLPDYSEYDVGTGKLTKVRDFVEKLTMTYENIFGRIPTKLNFGAIPLGKGEMMTVNVDNIALTKLGWSAKINLIEGLNRLIKED